MLKFNGAWRFDPPASIPGVVSDFSDLIGKIATQGDRQDILEHFKAYFAPAAGTTTTRSSSESRALLPLRAGGPAAPTAETGSIRARQVLLLHAPTHHAHRRVERPLPAQQFM